MARRNLTAETTVLDTSQGGVDQGAAITGAIADIGMKIVQQSQEAKINENISKAQLDISKLDNEFRIRAEADPFNKEMGAEYISQRRSLLAGYKEQISPFYRMQFDESVRRVTANADSQMQAWQFKQANQNTKNSITASMENNFLQASQDGMTFGTGDSNDANSMMNFATSQKELTQFISKNLGPESANTLLKDYQKDYVKSFLSGVAQTNPTKADAMLKEKGISELFTAEEIDGFDGLIRRNIRQKTIDELMAKNGYAEAATDVVYGDGDYFTKRNAIDKMELTGLLDNKTAAQARRVLTSEKSLNGLTSNEHMSDIINQMYDLNAIQETDSEGYLTGVANLRDEILTRQASGELTAQDAQKLDKQLRSLSGQKLAQSTQRVGINFYDAKEQFNVLPPQYRGEAIRELFYRTNGDDTLPATEMNKMTNSIIDEIKGRARQKTEQKLRAIDATGTVSGSGMPPPLTGGNDGKTVVAPPLAFNRGAFMKKHNITAEKLAAKAQATGLSQDEVLQQFYVASGGK